VRSDGQRLKGKSSRYKVQRDRGVERRSVR
jgi:hypothetical protein